MSKPVIIISDKTFTTIRPLRREGRRTIFEISQNGSVFESKLSRRDEQKLKNFIRANRITGLNS